MHSAERAISACWRTISLLYRRERNPDAPTCLIRFKYSQEPVVPVPLLLCYLSIHGKPVLLPLHICVCGSRPGNTIMKITSQQSSIKITANPSLYLLPDKKLLRVRNPAVLNRSLLVWLPVFSTKLQPSFIEPLLVGYLNYPQELLSSNYNFYISLSLVVYC